MTMHLDTTVTTSGFSAKQIKEINYLAQEGQRPGSKIAKDFTDLSCQETLPHCIPVDWLQEDCQWHLDCYTTYYTIMCSEVDNDKEYEELIKDCYNKVGHAWLDTNSALF